MPKNPESFGDWLKLEKPEHILGFLLKSLQHTLRQRIDEALLLASSKDAYQRELAEQGARLNALSIVDVDEEGATICPLCDSHVPDLSGTLTILKNELSDVASRVAALHENNPRLQSYVADLRKQRKELETRLFSNQAQVNAIVDQQEAIKRLREEGLQRSRVQGRITAFLENKTENNEAEIRSQIDLLRYRIDQLESKLAGDSFEERLRNAETNISNFMTEYAQELDLEHSEGRTRLDFKRLTVVADTANGAPATRA